MTTSIDTINAIVAAYYDSWQRGIAAFDEATLRRILAPDLLFEGPIAGSRTGSEGFVRGLADFAKSLRGLHMVQQVITGDEAAMLYDCELGSSSGTLRFAEFLALRDGRIQSIRLVYDPAAFLKLIA